MFTEIAVFFLLKNENIQNNVEYRVRRAPLFNVLKCSQVMFRYSIELKWALKSSRGMFTTIPVKFAYCGDNTV